MSDTSQGSGWWQASDGKWYGPELHPDSSTLAPSSSGNTGSVPEAGKDLEEHTYCTSCGTQAAAAASFCGECGRPLRLDIGEPGGSESQDLQSRTGHRKLMATALVLAVLAGGGVLIALAVSRNEGRAAPLVSASAKCPSTYPSGAFCSTTSGTSGPPKERASTTTAPQPVQLPCSSAALFPLVVQAEPSVTPTDVPNGGTPISVDCAGGWAILQDFTIQAGSGDGIALFKQAGTGWQFITMIDNSGGGPGWNPCSQYPPAALAALGTQICSPPAGTTTTTVATATVPDAVALGTQCGCSGEPRTEITQAGFTVQVSYSQSGACYYTTPTGQQIWNSGAVVGQSPDPGTIAPVGSAVTLDICSGTVSLFP